MTHKEIIEQSKKLLLLTGAKLFGSKGYDATSISVIEKDLNQTRGAIAYHFKSKLGLLRRLSTNTISIVSCSLPYRKNTVDA